MFQSFTGKEYLKIDIANNAGYDKENWDTRINWFNENEHNLDNMVKQAEKPALFYAGVQAWKKAQRGELVTYPISLDATASGIQIATVLTGDRRAAALCNVVDTGQRENAYTRLYELLMAKVGGKATLSAKEVKNAIMTAFYNSEAVPKKVFKSDTLIKVFYEVLSEYAPDAWDLTQAMPTFWNPNAYTNNWVLPDNFHVKVKVTNKVREIVYFLNEPFEVDYEVNGPTPKSKSLGPNMIHSVDGMIAREMANRCNYDPVKVNEVKNLCIGSSENATPDELVINLWNHYKKSGFLSTRIINYLNADNIGLVDKEVILEMISTLPRKPFVMISVHDCFRCLPNYGNDLRRQYNNILSDIAKSDMLSYLLTQIRQANSPICKRDNELYKDILDTNYALS